MADPYPPPPPRPSTFTFVDDQGDLAMHELMMANGCIQCRAVMRPICPDCYQCLYCGTGCSGCRMVRPRPRFGPPPGKRYRPPGT